MTEKISFENVEQYIGSFPEKVQTLLQQIRKAIKDQAPEAEELVSYGIAAFRYHGMLIYYAGYQKHVSIATAPFTVFEIFKKELAPYKRSKSTVQFPIDKPLPMELIGEMTKFRVKENADLAAEKAASKAAAKKKK